MQNLKSSQVEAGPIRWLAEVREEAESAYLASLEKVWRKQEWRRCHLDLELSWTSQVNWADGEPVVQSYNWG